MISTQKAQSIIEKAIDHARGRAQGTEVTVLSADIACSRFANNSMTQNQAPDRTEVSVRVLKNGRQARLSSDDLSPSAVCKLVDDAIATVKYLEKDQGLLKLPGQSHTQAKAVKRFAKGTAELNPRARSKAISEIIKIAADNGLQSAGALSTGATFVAIGNSNGLYVSHKETRAECSITMDMNGSTGWAKAEELDFDDLDYRALAERAKNKALANRNPIEIPPGKYRVILEPAAVLDLVGYLAWDFAATSHLDKLSCFMGKLGKKVFGDNISISDDCRHPLQSGAPFDGEGLPRQTVCLVENGMLKNLVSGRRSAKKMGLTATGHGLSEPNAEGETASNLVFAGGSSSLEEMIANEERAILLTRVWYIREVDPALKIVTGMTRDGSFLVENGKLVCAVKNLRFNESLIRLLNNAVALAPAKRTSGGEEGGAAVVPAMLVDQFNFSSSTTF